MRRLLLALLVLAPATAFADVSGPALVMDGDTVTVGGEDISLHGVHAPMIVQYCGQGEDSWACGWDAANLLEEIIGGREVTCTDVAEGPDEKLYGTCTVDGDDLAGLMVDQGMAVADPESGELYKARADAASEAGVGMWSGPFIDPVTWAEIGDCGCSARKKSMMETAALLKAQRDAEAAAAEEEELTQ